MINLFARLGDSASAHQHLRWQIERTTFHNLMDSHPRLQGTTACFQIDGNFGTTAAIAEMLVQSHAGEIQLLPALPKQWANGSFRGLRSRGGFVVDVTWKNSKPTQARVISTIGGECKLRSVAPFQVRDGDNVIASSVADGEAFVAGFRSQAETVYTLHPQP